MDLIEAIVNRRSVRKYQDKDVPDELLVKAFEAARYAPSGGNFQGWKFLVIKNKEMIAKIADAAQQKLDTITGWPEAEKFGDTPAQYRQRAVFFRNAPVLVAAVGGQYQSITDKILALRGKDDPYVQEITANRNAAPTRVQQIGGMVAHLLLIFHSQGLGACWMAGPLIAKKEIEKLLGITGEWDLMALIPVGYPAQTPECKDKKSVEELVTFIR
jgi:nitroreductase